MRRQIIERYGDNALYEGGLSVRTSLDPRLQVIARKVLQGGLISYDERRGFHGPIKTVEIGSDWGIELSKVPAFSDVPEWKLAVVLATDSDGADIGLQPRKEPSGKVAEERVTGRIPAEAMKWAYRSARGDRKSARSPEGVLSPGDVVYVEPTETEGSYRLRQPPRVQGGLVAMGLDLTLRQLTQHKVTLDDVMRCLWHEFALQQ